MKNFGTQTFGSWQVDSKFLFLQQQLILICLVNFLNEGKIDQIVCRGDDVGVCSFEISIHRR